MNIKYKIEKYTYPDGRVMDIFQIERPFQDLNIIKSYDNLDDLNYFIEWIEELLNRNIPDSSELGVIIYQGILWGSVKSKIVELVRDAPFVEKEEFYTADLLKLCHEWRDFLIKNKEAH